MLSCVCVYVVKCHCYDIRTVNIGVRCIIQTSTGHTIYDGPHMTVRVRSVAMWCRIIHCAQSAGPDNAPDPIIVSNHIETV